MIYLLGGSGYVGQAYQALLARKGIPFRNLRRADLDYTNPALLIAALRADRPEFLINAAGYTGKPNVDACELHKGECLMGNAVLPGLVAEACTAASVPWGHVSSGCIFTGARPDGSGFTEGDAPSARTTARSTAAPRPSVKRCSPAAPISSYGACASRSTR